MKQNKFKILAGILISLFILIRIISLGPDISNSDAARWHRRSIMFLNALKRGDFAETYQRYHPGVTLMWLNSFVKQASFSYQLTYTKTPKTLENADYYPIQHGISKGVNIIVLAVLLGFQIYGLEKVFNKKTALIYAFLISLEPYMVGINRWFHQTSFEVFFGFTAVLFILIWNKEKKNLQIALSAVFLALSILSKVTSLVLIPVFAYYLLKTKKIKPALIFFSTLALTIFAVFPALWVKPVYVLSQIYSAVTSAVGSGSVSIFYYFIILAFKLSPVTLLIFVVSLINLKKIRNENILAFLGTLLIYLLFLTISRKKIDRYSLAMIPYILTVSSFYLTKTSIKAFKIILISATIFFIYISIIYHPVYSAYYSPFFGGAKKALDLGVYENSGEYFAQAAFYLNGKSRNMLVYIPDNIESFNYYYKGNVENILEKEPDYIVSSLDKDRKSDNDLQKCGQLDKTFGPGGFNAVYVYKCN